MADTFRLDSNAVYDDGALVLGLGLTHATLANARRRGELRYARKGRRVLYLGRWVGDWLERDQAGQGVADE